MKAIILSAGQGKRLLPLTEHLPKCLLQVQGKTILEWQLDTLLACGVTDVTVVVGYQAEQVEAVLRDKYRKTAIHTLLNAEFSTTDNLVSCWLARTEMQEDFLLLNGDTLFEPAILRQLLKEAQAPVTVTVNQKNGYDSDDMKVSLAAGRLLRIGKDIPQAETDGESIGLLLFRGTGPKLFREGLEKAVADTSLVWRWFLSVVNAIAQEEEVRTCLINGKAWCEIDYPADLECAQQIMAEAAAPAGSFACRATS